ncbi:calcium and integrin-binding family member 2 isoform X2 [Anthonomus grandis grandis]|uniref:calcium and integrin-binding family member 2 isoform X2 n=1 Tax=Anthonomus grandis grandis TaxID=2921223 RepID=UPI0021655FB9|nr:calcium and integrin-binding family member 2 isoform X2 [Anthonomus grandis grandis]
MGNKLITFTDQQLVNYQDCTFFTRKDILRVYKKFRDIKPDLIPRVIKGNEAYSIKIPVEYIEELAEFKENPFKRRILEVFSRDAKGNLTFEDFLDMLSVFSEGAPRDIKVFYAFRIYGPEDIDVALTLLTKQELTAEEKQQITEKVMEESDVDGDGKLSYIEFEHCITRAPEFLSTFHIRI